MQREYFRIVIGSAVIVVHIICYVIIAYSKAEYFTPAQQTDIGLLFMPITAAYVVAIVRGAIEQQEAHSHRTVNLNYCIIISLFTVATLFGLLLTVSDISHDIDFARRQILLFEIAFGTAFGLIVSDLFGKVEVVHVAKVDQSTTSRPSIATQ